MSDLSPGDVMVDMCPFCFHMGLPSCCGASGCWNPINPNRTPEIIELQHEILARLLALGAFRPEKPDQNGK